MYMLGIEIWLYSLAPLLICTISLWVFSLLLKNASIIDIFWGLGFVTVFWLTSTQLQNENRFQMTLLGATVTLWGLRLAIHIFLRSIGKGEDARYAKFRTNAGHTWWWSSLFKVFIFQGLLIWIISAPISITQATPMQRGPLVYFGFCIWLIGFIFEAGGDLQLARFKSLPKNKGGLLTTGFWGLTRHPNYFGDATQWWGFWLMSLSQYTWWTIFSPILMTVLLLKFSGVPITERMMRKDKPAYKNYIDSVPAFVPNIFNVFRSNQ
ncbi:MAG TPA: hypothetical protein DGN60_02665 [Chloroflexi bacterium]|nr:hypothetical protein [Chloroflexota bacterium]